MVMKLRGLGVPKTDVERVMEHYGLDQAEAERWLDIHPASELLPERGGFSNLAALPGEKLVVVPGETVRVTLSVEYRGPALDGRVWTAIGVKGIWFDEIFYSATPVHFDDSYDFVPYIITCDVPITDKPGIDYDMYAKIMEIPGPDIFTDYYLNIIDVLAPAEFRDFAIISYDKV